MLFKLMFWTIGGYGVLYALSPEIALKVVDAVQKVL